MICRVVLNITQNIFPNPKFYIPGVVARVKPRIFATDLKWPNTVSSLPVMSMLLRYLEIRRDIVIKAGCARVAVPGALIIFLLVHPGDLLPIGLP